MAFPTYTVYYLDKYQNKSGQSYPGPGTDVCDASGLTNARYPRNCTVWPNAQVGYSVRGTPVENANTCAFCINDPSNDLHNSGLAGSDVRFADVFLYKWLQSGCRQLPDAHPYNGA